MKSLVLILSIFFSLSPGGNEALSYDMCLTAAQGYTFAGSEDGNSVSVRTVQGGRRTSSQANSSSRILKGGKVVGNTQFFLFPGAQIPTRYLFALCCLRL